MTHLRVTVAIVFHSGGGHTARQASAVAEGVRSQDGAEAVLVPVVGLDGGAWQALDEADAIVFGTPTYMGSPAAAFKAFAEATQPAWADGMRWRGKVAAGFSNSQAVGGDKLNSLVDLAILAAQHGMIWVGLDLYPGWATTSGRPEDLNRIGGWLGAMAQSHGDLGPDAAPPEADLRTAAYLGRRVARVAQELARGREREEALP
ncbi:MAG: flavodoxin family protein [bacterium]|jgi:multimeric flavodoxin WrbA|nr:flavodoxin family protein [bacterium]